MTTPPSTKPTGASAPIRAARTQAAPKIHNPVSADHLRTIMPHAGAKADTFADPLNRAMSHFGIDTPTQKAAFLAQISEESGDLQFSSEITHWSASRLIQVFPRQFPSPEIANRYVGRPEAILNRAYANSNGNGDEASGDGYKYRGRGMLQITGRNNYRALGFEKIPDAVAEPYSSAFAAAGYWRMNHLNHRTRTVLNRQQFDAIVGQVNRGRLGFERRWQAYQRALMVLQPR